MGGETRTLTVLEYSETFSAVVLVNHNNWGENTRAIFRCRGTEGQSEGSFGNRGRIPRMQAGCIPVRVSHCRPRRLVHAHITERWIPDAFVGPMAELLCALEEDREALTSGSDNLSTLRIVEAAYLSARRGRRVTIHNSPHSPATATTDA